MDDTLQSVAGDYFAKKIAQNNRHLISILKWMNGRMNDPKLWPTPDIVKDLV